MPNNRSDGFLSDSDAPPSRRRHVASVLSDSMANTLFSQEPPTHRFVIEMRLRTQVSKNLRDLHEAISAGMISMSAAQKRLERLDEWLAPRLSGENVLGLAREIETTMPELVIYLPNLIGKRYEELRVARLWSALLNPGALGHLRAAIAQENALNDDGDLL